MAALGNRLGDLDWREHGSHPQKLTLLQDSVRSSMVLNLPDLQNSGPGAGAAGLSLCFQEVEPGRWESLEPGSCHGALPLWVAVGLLTVAFGQVT